LTLAAIEQGVCAIGRWRNVVVIVWKSAGTQPAAEKLARLTSQMRITHLEGVSHIHLVKNRAGLPDSAARTVLVNIMREHSDGIGNCAVVIGGTGFWASTMRSAITSMRLISPRSFEMRLHGTSAEILDWLPDAHEARTGVKLAREVLARLLQQAERWFDEGLETATLR
jgi:hypothetical protein